MPDPKNKSSIQKVYNQLKLKNDEEIANQKKDELNQFKKGYNPSSNKYKKQLQDLKDKQPEITQDNFIKKDRDFNKKYHDEKEWDDKKWAYYENAATVAELGNFVPHPAAQVVGKAGSLASAALSARKAKLEYDKGNYLNAGLNAGLGLFSAGLGAKTGINTVKDSKLNSFERSVAPREFVSNISNGVEIGRMHYNVPNYLNVIAKNNPDVLKNRISLGLVGTDAVTDFKDPEAIKYAEGGFLNSNPPINGYKDPTIFQKYVTDPLRSNPNYNINSDRLLNVKDNRKINATSGKKINPNKDLMSGKYSEQLIADITKEAVKQGIDPYTAIAISLQETNLGRRDGNVGHVLSKYGTGDPIYDMVSSLKQSQEKAKSLGLKNENDVLQTYNGRGKIFPNTEQGYHGFKMKQIYGVDLPAEGIDMKKNPLYGKRVIDLRENIVKQNPSINTIVNNKGLSVDPFTTPLNTYAEGGNIDPKKKKPIVVKSENDPRYQAYEDSLYAYNNTKNLKFNENINHYSTLIGNEKKVRHGTIKDKQIPYKSNKKLDLSKYANSKIIHINTPYSPFELPYGSSIDPYTKNVRDETFKRHGIKGTEIAFNFPFEQDNIVRQYINKYKEPQQQVILKPNSNYHEVDLMDYYKNDKIKPSGFNQDGKPIYKEIPIAKVNLLQNNLQPAGLISSKNNITADTSGLRPNVINPKAYNVHEEHGGSTTDYQVADVNNINTDQNRKQTITPQYSYGGNLNNNMKQYSQGGQLTHFNEGGSHEQNPNGGIPLGNNASVEQGETKKGNYVYSDRLYINEDLVKQFNLPNSIKGKTFANASKVIEKPFKDKNSNPDRATQKEHLDRLKEAQETLKEQEAKMQKSMQANSQEIPDQMNGEIPEGMEQFMGQEQEQPQQFAGGGYYDTNNPYGFTNPGQQPIQGPYNQVPIGIGSPAGLTSTPGATMSAPTNMGNSAGLPAGKGMGSAASFGNVMGGIGVVNSLAQGDTTGALVGGATLATSNGLLGAGASGVMGAAGPALGVLGAAQGAMSLGALSQGQGASRGNGASAATGAMTGAMAGAAFGPVGAGVGAVAGAGAGLMGANKARKEAAALGRLNAHNANNVYKDTEVIAAYGGPIPIGNPLKKTYGNIYNEFNSPLSEGTLDNNELTNSLVAQRNASLSKGYGATGPVTDPSLNNFTNNFGEPARFNKITPTTTPNVAGPSFLQKAGSFLKDNKGELMRLAPVGMNALQLANLKRPGQVSLNRLSNVYKPSYIDEAGIQNRLDSENQNTINALTNSSGGSEASLRAGIMGSQAARLRARGDAYAGIQQYNNSQDAAAQNFKLGVDQANIGQANLQQDINDKNMGNYDTQKSKLLGQIGTDIGSIGKENVFGKKAGQMFGYDENGKYIITPEGTKTYISKEESTTLTPEQKAYLATMPKAYGGYLRKNKKGY